MDVRIIILMIVLGDLWIMQGHQIEDDGEVVQPGEYPFLMVVLIKLAPVCSATLFTESRLLTTCQCLMKDSQSLNSSFNYTLQDPSAMEVVAGSSYNDFVYYHDEEAVRFAIELDVHPKCVHNMTAILFDYGLVKINRPFILGEGSLKVFPITEEEKGKITQTIMRSYPLTCILLGWIAKTEEEVGSVGLLKKIKQNLMPLEWCKKTIQILTKHSPEGQNQFSRNVNVCSVGEIHLKESACGGDGAGPLMCGEENKIYVGMLSGRPSGKCGEGSIPNVIARLDFAMEWIINASSPDSSTVNPTVPNTPIDPHILSGCDEFRYNEISFKVYAILIGVLCNYCEAETVFI